MEIGQTDLKYGEEPEIGDMESGIFDQQPTILLIFRPLMIIFGTI